MRQIHTTLDNNIIKAIHTIAEQNQQSFSATVREIVEKGLEKYKQRQADNAQDCSINKPLSEEKKAEYLLRILNIGSDLLRKSYHGKSIFGTEDPEALLGTIKKNSQKYVQQLLDGKNEGKKCTLKARLFEKDK